MEKKLESFNSRINELNNQTNLIQKEMEEQNK